MGVDHVAIAVAVDSCRTVVLSCGTPSVCVLDILLLDIPEASYRLSFVGLTSGNGFDAPVEPTSTGSDTGVLLLLVTLLSSPPDRKLSDIADCVAGNGDAENVAWPSGNEALPCGDK